MAPLFRAVHEAGSYYWDGLFSQNPPVRELPDADAEEIWVIRINPLARGGEPTAIATSPTCATSCRAPCGFNRSLYFIGKVNQWAGRLGGRYRHITVREIALDRDLALVSKLDRRAGFITELQHEGRQQAERYLTGLPG